MIIKCPNCSSEVEFIPGECEFCPECGSDLTVQEQQQQATDVPQQKTACEQNEEAEETFSDQDTIAALMAKLAELKADKSRQTYRPVEKEENWDLSAKSKMIADDIDSFDIFSTSSSTCKHLKVEYNHNLHFLTGSQAVIQLRLTPLDDQLKDLMIFMETERNGDHTRRQIPIREILRKNRSFSLQIPFNPENTFGKAFFIFYIGCKIDRTFKYYQFSVNHTVYDSKQSGNAIIKDITINQEFSAQHAADINYRDNFGEAMKKLADKNLTVNELIDRLNAMPPNFCEQDLIETTWRPEDILVKGNLYRADKLILEYEGKSLILINKPKVVFGRDRNQADLLVRCGQGKLGQMEYPNSTVSRKHAEILYCDDTVKLFDHSSYGTYINGKKPDGPGIPLALTANVEFGDICWEMNIQQCAGRLPHNICQTCTANKVKSVTFKRKDKEPEYYLLIWQCCELGRLIEDLTDWTIFTRDGSFFIRTPNQDFHYLRPGHPITYNNKTVNVRLFKQA